MEKTITVDAMEEIGKHSIIVNILNARGMLLRLNLALPFLWLGARIAGMGFEVVIVDENGRRPYDRL